MICGQVMRSQRTSIKYCSQTSMYVKVLHLKMHTYLRTKYVLEPVFDERGLMITMLTMAPITETRTFALVPHRIETLVMIDTPSLSEFLPSSSLPT